MRSNYLEDGYTESFFLKADGLVNSDMRFSARPYTAAELTKLAGKDNDGAALVSKIAACIAERVTSWDLVDKSGAAVPVSATAALRVKPTRFYRIYACLCGNDGGDQDGTSEPKADRSDDAKN